MSIIFLFIKQIEFQIHEVHSRISKNRTVYNFRGDLLKAIIAKGYDVIVTGAYQTDVDKIEALGARFI